MLLRCCLIHITIILLRYHLYLVYLCPCFSRWSVYVLSVGFIFHFQSEFLLYNLIQTEVLVFTPFLEYFLLFLDDNIDERSEYFSNSKSSASGCCLAFARYFANFSLALPMKVLLLKKRILRYNK